MFSVPKGRTPRAARTLQRPSLHRLSRITVLVRRCLRLRAENAVIDVRYVLVHPKYGSFMQPHVVHAEKPTLLRLSPCSTFLASSTRTRWSDPEANVRYIAPEGIPLRPPVNR